ncbi:MAG: redoxin domain-containing protein [Gammaproteobacteria bacterium]|nr:redoxin domain-containing protein [Gammaproteobacteria bacterium]
METNQKDFLDKLAELRAAHCDQVPTPQMAVLVRLTARLRRSGMTAHCLQVGETAPDFEFACADGTRSSLYERLEQGPVVVNFFRGLWCAYCRTELEAFEMVRSQLEEIGCSYIAVSPQPIADPGTMAGVDFAYDHDNAIAREFDLVYELEAEELRLFEEWGIRTLAGDSTELPLPATYVVATDLYGRIPVRRCRFSCPLLPRRPARGSQGTGRFALGLAEEQGEAVGVARHRVTPYLVAEFIVGSIVQVAIIDELEADRLDFLDDSNRIHASPVRIVVGLHVASVWSNDPVKPAGLQRVEHRLVDVMAGFLAEVVHVAERECEVDLAVDTKAELGHGEPGAILALERNFHDRTGSLQWSRSRVPRRPRSRCLRRR